MKQLVSSIIETWPISEKQEYSISPTNDTVLFPKKAFSAWQQELLKHMGLEHMKKASFQFGWSQGKEIAQSVMDNTNLGIISQLLEGTDIHQSLGQAKVTMEIKQIEMEEDEIISILFSGKWQGSYEVDDYLQSNMRSRETVCNTLCGFASGYTSTIIGKKVFFKEHACEARGDAACQWEGRLLEHWNKKEYEVFFEENDGELKQTQKAYEKIEEERNLLQRVIDIQNALTEELIRSNQMENIMNIIKEYISVPIIIENKLCNITFCENITKEGAIKLQPSFHKELKKWPVKKVGFLEFEDHCRLVAPIYLRNQIIGYCSFIYDMNTVQADEIDRMILGRLANISALVYLNDKNIMEANSRTKGILFEKMLADEFESKEQIIRELNLLNIDVSSKYHIAFLALKYNGNSDEDNLSNFTSIYEEVIQLFQEMDYEVLQVQRANGILCFIPADGNLEMMRNGPGVFRKRVMRNFSKINCHIGISSTTNDLKNVNSLMNEAMTAARFTTEHETVIYFEELGILGMLIHSQEESAIKKIAEMELGAIYGETEQQKEYMLTLYEFLINGGNLELTSAKLRLSVSGLRYRINKIREITNADLKDSQKQFDLLLSLKALKVIGYF